MLENPQKALLFLDLETSSLDPCTGEILEIGAVLTDPTGHEIQAEFQRKTRPQGLVDPAAAAVNGYDPVVWDREGFPLEVSLNELARLAEDRVLVAHNVAFDWGFLEHALKRHKIPWKGSHRRVCTQALAWPLVLAGKVEGTGLDKLIQHFWPGVTRGVHGALEDAQYCRHVYTRLIPVYTRALGQAQAIGG